MAQVVKNPPAMCETWVPSLGWEDPLEKGILLQYSSLEHSMDCIVHGVTKNGTRLSDFHFHSIHLLFAIDSKLLQRMDLCVPHVTYI